MKGNATHSYLQSQDVHVRLRRHVQNVHTHKFHINSTAEVRGELMKAWYKNGLIRAHPDKANPEWLFFFLATVGKQMAGMAPESMKMAPQEPEGEHAVWMNNVA